MKNFDNIGDLSFALNPYYKNNTCCVTGHRVLKKDFDYEKLRGIFLSLIERDYNIFLVGMALGFDTACFKVLYDIRKEKKIEIDAVVPCRDQDKFFTAYQKIEYHAMLAAANKVIELSHSYTEGCMQIRNRYMVDNSSAIVVYKYAESGGTYYTSNYAEKQGLEIIDYFKNES